MENNFKKRTVFIVLMILIISCKSNQTPEWYSDYRKEVNDKVFEKFLVKDEKTLASYWIARYPALINEIGFSAIFINPYETDTLSYERRVIEIKNKSIQKIDLSDKEKYFFIPNKEEVIADKMPLPDIKHKELEKFLDFQEPIFYITDKNNGKFIKNEKFYNFKDSLKSDFKWKHGFTNGAILDEKNKKIIYYLLIW